MSGQISPKTADPDRRSFLQEVIAVFRNADYHLSEQTIRCAGFDFFAEKQGDLVVTKACTTLDSFKYGHGMELRLISDVVSASPVIVANKKLNDDAVYNRHGIPGINLTTLTRLLHHGLLPHIISRRGGFYHQIRGEEIPDDEVVLEKIAREVGITGKTLRYWKEGKSLPSPDRLKLLARALDKRKSELIRPVNPLDRRNSVETSNSEDNEKYFRPRDSLQRHVGDLLQEMDIQAKWFQSTPFDAICTGNVASGSAIIPLVAGTGTETRESRKRIKTTANILKIIHKSGIWISEANEYSNDSIIPVMSVSELEKIKKHSQFEKTIKEKQRKHVKKIKRVS
ncbi:MAG: helix-turn-helix domain-containing protein [Candidatus Odinarchaeota archaeon]